LKLIHFYDNMLLVRQITCNDFADSTFSPAMTFNSLRNPWRHLLSLQRSLLSLCIVLREVSCYTHILILLAPTINATAASLVFAGIAPIVGLWWL
jgi:hypothetical protein